MEHERRDLLLEVSDQRRLTRESHREEVRATRAAALVRSDTEPERVPASSPGPAGREQRRAAQGEARSRDQRGP